MRVVAVHHRLSGLSGHRYNEGLGLVAEADLRGWDLDLLVSVHAPPAVLAGLGPRARGVLHDPTFDLSRTFEERVESLAGQLDEHVRDADRVLLTVATQCETAALARWAGRRSRVPWVCVLFLSDRWNCAEARTAEPAELAATAVELGHLDTRVLRRFVLTASTQGLASELTSRLRQPVCAVPATLNYDDFPDVTAVPHPVPVLGLLGGTRPEKGSGLLVGLVTTLADLPVEIVVQAFDEGTDEVTFAQVLGLAGRPRVRLLEGTLGCADYVRDLAGLELLLCPYERRNYVQRNSGLFCEAAAACIPSVVPSGTWLAQRVEQGRAAGIV
jgi:hypothetical protein